MCDQHITNKTAKPSVFFFATMFTVYAGDIRLPATPKVENSVPFVRVIVLRAVTLPRADIYTAMLPSSVFVIIAMLTV